VGKGGEMSSIKELEILLKNVEKDLKETRGFVSEFDRLYSETVGNTSLSELEKEGIVTVVLESRARFLMEEALVRERFERVSMTLAILKYGVAQC